MEANPILFRDLTYIFLAAVAGGLLAWRLKLPLILGFVVGGIVISPFTPGPHLSDLHTFEVFAEVGVVLLMFSIGVEFSVPDLMRVKWIALGGGALGILLSIGLALGTAWLFGWSMIQGFVVGTPMLRSTDWPTGEPRELPRILAVTSGMILTPRDPLPS